MRPRDDCQCVWDDVKGFRRRIEGFCVKEFSLYGKCLDGIGRLVYISDFDCLQRNVMAPS